MHTEVSRTNSQPLGRRAFGGFGAPELLLKEVYSTAPYLEPFVQQCDASFFSAQGWLGELHRGSQIRSVAEPDEATWVTYFGLCLAAHFASAATYVPTNVDSKIRDHLWFRPWTEEGWSQIIERALALRSWDVSLVTRRDLQTPWGRLSGHDGECLSVWCGGLLASCVRGDEKSCERFRSVIAEELQREAQIFLKMVETHDDFCATLMASAILTHNVGDVDQGLSATGGRRAGSEDKRRFGRLAHERFERFDWAFFKAAALYKDVMAPEGHRNYPLRQVKALRRSNDLLFPLAPFLEAWGKAVANAANLSDQEKAEVVEALLLGCENVPGQNGYFRALYGFSEAYGGGLHNSTLNYHLGTAAKRYLKDAELRQRLAIGRQSFASSMAKRAQKILESFRRPS